ncbi:MAG: sugar-binding transcriptional regulator [Leptolinea sp.]|jgi:DNA-binding transcriptional regulator LsrR (DeoR family)|nr:sugar-binding transcriptional regulator [Leptolinea sp.]
MEENEIWNAMLARVTYLFYEQNKSLQEITDITGISRTMVSRMIPEARERGIVEIKVHFPWRSKFLETELNRVFGLKLSRVMVMDTPSESELLIGLGKLAADYLQPLIHDDMVIGISWGTALQYLIQFLSPRKMRGVEIVQLIGSSGLESNLSKGPLLAQQLTDRLSATCRYLNAPLVAESHSAREALLKDPGNKATLSQARKANIALIGIGSIHPDLYSLKIAGYVTEEQRREMAEAGVVGDCCGHHFSIEGKLVNIDINRRTVGIDLTSLPRIEQVVAVSGDVRKGDAILGALRGKFMNVLITDAETAQYLLDHV